jgi:hypothetical protein
LHQRKEAFGRRSRPGGVPDVIAFGPAWGRGQPDGSRIVMINPLTDRY